MLFEVLDKLKQQTVISTVLLMVLGLLMLIIPEQYDGTLVDVLAVAAQRYDADFSEWLRESRTEIGFLNDLRRMNVAMTRARMKLIIIGDAETLSHHPFYKKLYEKILPVPVGDEE